MQIPDRVIELLAEMPIAQMSPMLPTKFYVDYYAITPKGSRGRFQRTSTLQHTAGGHSTSEFAILGVLRKLHPGCDIEIQNLRFA
jgi:hypothetical protein